MMDIGPPDQKRPRLSGPVPPGPWQTSPETSRQLPPPPPPPPYPPHNPSFSRPTDPPPYPIDRRTSEHTQYDHQDPRRPSSGPLHGYPPPQPPPTYTGPRDAMVKRDPSEEGPPQPYRTNSTGNGQDHNSNPSPHEGRPYLPPFNDGPPRAPYQSNPYPPVQSPMSATEPYSHPIYGSSGLLPPREYPSVSYPPATRVEQVRKKAQRAAQACDMCRTLKAKCDEGRPACSSCMEKKQECRYRDPPPKQQDKASADIMESLMRIENVVTGLNVRIADLSGDMVQIKRDHHRLLLHIPNVPQSEGSMKEEAHDAVQMPQTGYSIPSVGAESQVPPSNESPYSSTPGQRVHESVEPFRPPQDIVESFRAPQDDDEEEEVAGGNPKPTKEPSIPVNHTTGAARLLLVAPIAEMCKKVMNSSKIKNEKYPIVQEGKRGLLRVYGRGEGQDYTPGYHQEFHDYQSEGTPGDSHSDVSSPSGEEWGQVGGLTPPPNPPGYPPLEITRGGISPEGMPDFSRETVYDLVKSYKENINNMHPLLIPRHLDTMVEHFLKSLPEGQARSRQLSSLVTGHAPPAGFVGVGGGYRNPESPGNKRKRSPGTTDFSDVPSMLDYKPGHPFRSIGTALVLLVLALGKICKTPGKISDVWRDNEVESDGSFSSSPTVRNGHPPSPIQNSPSMAAMGIMSPQEQPRSRRTSIEGAFQFRSNASKPRNLDVIPGLAYFALATDIIGNQLAGNTLQHVHANLLAGLYHGQLARVMESYAYIHAACRALQVILRPKLDRFRKLKEEIAFCQPKDNPVIFAFWTCLQLESDIIAELPVPHSGILAYEDDMPSPNLYAANDVDGFDPMTIESYSAQLFLRKHLNQLHNMFYKPENDSKLFPSVLVSKEPKRFPTIVASEESLKWMDKYAPSLNWDVDKGEPAKDILGARLRAKYYGAQVITYRHFVLKILEHSPTRTSQHGQQIADDFLDEIKVPTISKNVTTADEIDSMVLQYARNGIKALIFSTKAFHGLGDPAKDRLIVTNVWGTAHAQWGNMLTLQAAYMNPILRPLLDELISVPELQSLLDKTLAFLDLVATKSSALRIDWRILKATGEFTGLLPNPSSSFSSTATGDVMMGGH